MKKILLIGATSAIATACARVWAERGDSLFLVGRDSNLLSVMVSDMQVRGAAHATSYAVDLNDFEKHKDIFRLADSALDGIDIVLIAHGTLSNQKSCENSIDETLSEIKTNALSVVSLLTLVASIFERKQAGIISVISSIAGERGRESNYVYGSSKAMVTAFTSGLRQRLYKANVAVVTIKPGFVDTPMTAGFRKGPLWAKPESVAKKIVSSIDNRRNEVYVPGFWGMISFIVKSVPSGIFKRLSL